MTLRRLLPGLTLAGFLSASCAENDSSIYVRGVLAIDETSCVARAEGSSLLRGFGVLDVALREDHTYTAALLVGNQLFTQGDRTKLRTETARVAFRGAEVTIVDPELGELEPYSVQATGFADPAPNADSPGLGFVFVPIVVPQERTSGEVTAKIRVYGVTLGGQDVESNEFWYPIAICSGCLVNYNSIDPVSGECVATDDQSTEDGERACFIGQDQPTDCLVCAGSLPACRFAPVAPEP